MNDPTRFDAYLLDPEHGWHVRRNLSFTDAVRLCRDYRRDWAGSKAVMVPCGQNAEPYQSLVMRQMTE